MTRAAGRALAGALLLAVATPGAAGAGAAPALEVVAADGAVLARLPLDPTGAFCLHWRHSVTGGSVADCFRFAAGAGGSGTGMVLTRSYLHDFAAGLGHLPGRGHQVPAPGGGYWIEGIDEAVPGGQLPLRVGGAAVGHRIATADGALDLSALAAGQRVTLRPTPPEAAPLDDAPPAPGPPSAPGSPSAAQPD